MPQANSLCYRASLLFIARQKLYTPGVPKNLIYGNIFGIGLGIAIIAPCLAREHLMYLREKRKREREQRAREQAEAIVAELQKEVAHLRSELAALKARSHSSQGENRD